MPPKVVRIDVLKRNRLVDNHLHLVEPIARRIAAHLPPCWDLDDLIQTGRLGLLDAAARYRPEKHGNTPFSAWARIKIRGAILDSLSVPLAREATQAPLSYAPEPSYNPVMEEIIDRERRRERLKATVIEMLPRRERQVIQERFSEGRKVREVAKVLSISRGRVQAIQRDAVKRLRRILA